MVSTPVVMASLILFQAPSILLVSSWKDQLPSSSRPRSHPMMSAGIASGATRIRPGAAMSAPRAMRPFFSAGLILFSHTSEKSKSMEKSPKSTPSSSMPSHSLILSPTQVPNLNTQPMGVQFWMRLVSLSHDSWSQGLMSSFQRLVPHWASSPMEGSSPSVQSSMPSHSWIFPHGSSKKSMTLSRGSHWRAQFRRAFQLETSQGLIFSFQRLVPQWTSSPIVGMPPLTRSSIPSHSLILPQGSSKKETTVSMGPHWRAQLTRPSQLSRSQGSILSFQSLTPHWTSVPTLMFPFRRSSMWSHSLIFPQGSWKKPMASSRGRHWRAQPTRLDQLSWSQGQM